MRKIEIGERFGSLVVVEEVPRDRRPSQNGRYYLCQCDCGNTKIIYGHNLKTGNTKSCGCLSRRIASSKNSIDMPIGDRVYGKDIAMKIGFSDNDLQIVERKDNIEQKCDILLTLKQGDVPENMLFGVNPNLTISDVKGFSYPEIVTDLQNTFLQDDLFDSVVVSDMQFTGNGNMEVNIKIKTKYDYQTEKKVVI